MTCLATESVNFILIFLGAVAIWCWTDSIVIEVPYLVTYLPEGWHLGSYVSLMKGLSGGFMMLLVPLFFIKGTAAACFTSFFLGLFFSVTMCVFWDNTVRPSQLFSDGFSLGFLINTFCLMGLDSVRMAAVFTFASSLRSDSLMTAVLIGEGGGGVIAICLSIIQGFRQFTQPDNIAPGNSYVNSSTMSGGTLINEPSTSDDFIFEPGTYFVIVSCLFLISFMSFCLFNYINRTPKITTSNLDYESIPSEHDGNGAQETLLLSSELRGVNDLSNQEESWPILRARPEIPNNDLTAFGNTGQNTELETCRNDYSVREKYLLWLTWVLSNGSVFLLLPPFQSFSSLPYGERCFILSASAWAMSVPVSAFVAYFIRIRNISIIYILLIFHFLIGGFLVAVASQSPDPPFVGAIWAELVIVFMWALQSGSGFYIFSVSCYCLTQIGEGAVKGAAISTNCSNVICCLISFSLVNFSGYFNQA